MRNAGQRAAFVLLSCALLLGAVKWVPEQDAPPVAALPDVYVSGGYAVSTEAAYDQRSLDYAARKLQQLYDSYLTGNDGHIYLSVIPDKGSFVPAIEGYTPASAQETADALLAHMRAEHEADEAEHEHEHHHHHSGKEEIGHLIGHLPVSEKVRADIRAVYDSIAQAESHVHGVPVTDIHFHEVGTMDAVADVTAVCLLMEELAADQVIASPVHVGSGTVRCAHGVLPVPAPATAYLLRDVPIYGGAIQGELCTPTVAALLRHFVTRFGDMPVMTLESVGYGMGQKEFPRANCLRAMLGETAAESGDVVELACNLDDMTGEGIAFAMERLLAAGALDVYTLPIGMKKSRPGVMLCVLCREEQREDMVHLLLRHTTTLGVRESRHRRYTLSRSQDTVDSPWGPVARKTSQGWGVRRQKPEYEDLARIAREQNLTLDQVRDRLK